MAPISPLFLFSLICLIIPQYNAVIRTASTELQGCIKSLIDLERSLLTNDDNLQSLVRTFYPANRYPALWVEVNYYSSNDTTNNNSTITNGDDNNAVSWTNYTFYWSTTPVLIYIHPKLLEGISLKFVTIEYQFTHLVISSFCSSLSEYDILRILNDATIWLKSYTVNRVVSITEGYDTSLQGYTARKLSPDRDDYSVFDRETLYQGHVYRMVAALFMSVLFSQLLAPIHLWKNYGSIQRKTKQGLQHNGQHFRFKSIFWGMTVVLFITIIVIMVLDLDNFISFGLQWNDRNQFIYYLLLCGLFILLAIDVTFASVITIKAKMSNELLEVPRLLRFASQEGSKFDTVCLLSYQFFFLLTMMLSALALSFHTCGVAFAILANPIQVFATMILAIITFIALFYLFTFIFERYELHEKRNKIVQFSEAMFLLCMGVVFIGFLILFGITYLNVILFAGTDSTGVLSSLSQLFPAIVLAFIGWLVKKEYDNFMGLDNATSSSTKTQDRNTSNTNFVCKKDDPNTISLQPLTSTSSFNKSSLSL